MEDDFPFEMAPFWGTLVGFLGVVSTKTTLPKIDKIEHKESHN